MRPSAWVVLVVALVLGAGILAGCPGQCRYDTDCPGAHICLDGACDEPSALSMAQEGRCQTATDCALGERCAAGRCTVDPPSGNGNGEPDTECEVTRSADCSEGLCGPTGEVAACDDPPCPLELSCRPAVGNALPAWACTADGDCGTGWCREGVCASVCVDDSHCPSGFDCAEVTARPPWGTEDGRIRLCEPGEDTRVACGADRHCGEGLVCVWDYPSSISTYCTEPLGAGIAGERCVWGQCRSGICLSNGRCTSTCQETPDCEAGTICGEVEFTGVPGSPTAPGCVPPADACFAPTDCDMEDSHQCRTRLVLGTDHPVFQCRGSSEASPAGGPCAAGSDCLSGLCTPDGVCGHVCDDDDHCRCAYGPSCFSCEPTDACALEDWHCGTMPLTVAERTYTVRVCRPD
jgi:hypothetical protein